MQKKLLNQLHIVVLCSAALFVSGCEGVRSTLGLGRNVPDEFAVAKQQPLEVPPDYSLKPPQPGAPRPQEAPAPAQAAQEILGAVPQASPSLSAAETALIGAAPVVADSENIRTQLDQDAQILRADLNLVQSLLGVKATSGTEKDVDAAAERERLLKNKAENKPADEGQTPVIGRRNERGWLGTWAQ